MKITKQARREAKQLFRDCLVNGVLDKQRVRRVVSLLVQQRRRGSLALLSHLSRLVRLDQQRRSARVEFVAPLATALEASLRENLSRLHGPGLNITFVPNPNLLAGLRIQVGSDLYDGSVRGRLTRLAQRF